MSAAVQRTTFNTSRLLEFASAKELVAQTGHEPEDWPLVAVKELLDNALDACEEAGIAPVIHVTVARGRIRVRDNGPGIPTETVASILDFTTRTSSREAYVAPDRGRQGNALKTIVAMPFALSGEEGTVEIVAGSIRHEIAFRIARVAQEPVIEHQQHKTRAVRIGTSITVHWPESSWSELEEVGSRFLPVLERFADLNPHLTLQATWWHGWRRERWTRKAIAPAWSKWTPSSPTSPHWYRVEDLERLVGAYLSHDRHRNTVRLLRDFLSGFAGLAGTAKRKAVLDDVGLQRAPLTHLLNGDDFNHDLVRRLLRSMWRHSRPIKAKALGPIGKDNIARSFERQGSDPATFRYKVVSGDDGVRWLLETAFAYRPDGGGRLLLCGVNWSAQPNTSDPFGLGYQLGASYCGFTDPVLLLVHLICPRPEFRDRGKSTLASHSPGYAAIGGAVEYVIADWRKQRESEIRDWRREQNRRERLQRQQEREVSLRDLVLKHLPKTIAQVSQNGQLSFTQRDLFYAVRPLVQQEHDKPIKYSYFKALLTEIENKQGEIPGLLREPRGSIYHPHLKQTIPLSTESVARYHRPFWSFNKLVQIEKAGFQTNLIETGWPEEFDCAIANTGGYTTRAVKDLLDLLSTSTEPVTVFCVHDADAAGTMIYQTLVEATKARGARKIEVVNLGVEPWEGIELGLEVEEVEPSKQRRPVARYVRAHDRKWRRWLEDCGFDSWEGWLQKYRIELNAMPPSQRIAWLTAKIEQYPPRKVVPPTTLLHQERVKAAREEIVDELTNRARIEERAEEMLKTIKWPAQDRLPKLITRFLDRARHRKADWRRPMRAAGERHAERALALLAEEKRL